MKYDEKIIDKEYEEALNKRYSEDIDSGKIERSNIEANKEFLFATNILKKEHKILEVGCGAGSMTSFRSSERYDISGMNMVYEMLNLTIDVHRCYTI